MSENMSPLSFRQLLTRALAEYERESSVFGVRAKYVSDGRSLPLFGGRVEMPFGPAAGPNTQLSQNILAGYYAGARFFELKTVQKMDGAELAACIARPCIKADDEGYNCEWSTELTVPQALTEYIHAYIAIKILSKRWELGDPDGFIFNMSVGYDLAGIQTPKMNAFIDGMVDAEHLPAFTRAIEEAQAILPDMAEYIRAIDPHICRSVTISTLHGCPPQEIESIASYLIREKHLHTLVKCNPTILGYDFARKRLDAAGYDDIAFDDHHFKEDLQYEDAVPMFHRLMALAKKEGVSFGVKLSNTFPVDVKAGELPSSEMYMSGKALYLLTMEMAARIASDFEGKLRISYSGGADALHLTELYRAGIWPITVATTILKPGGYDRFLQMARRMEKCSYKVRARVDARAVRALSEAAAGDPLLQKTPKPLPRRTIGRPVPLLDCFTAPCREGCPIHQDVPEYLHLMEKGCAPEALALIARRNPLPFITGTICAHNCMSKCTRHFYDTPVHIREVKLQAAKKGYRALMSAPPEKQSLTSAKVAVVGGGPAGLAAAYYLGLAGAEVTVYEKEKQLGGVVRQVIPEFRIPSASIDKDVRLVKAAGARFVLGKAAPTYRTLQKKYDYILLAAGARKSALLSIGGRELNAVAFLKAQKAGETPVLGEHVCVIGGGNTAMDAARAALRAEGVRDVTIVYRRTKKYMPADPEEMELAEKEGARFLPLLSPLSAEAGRLTCQVMELGAPDAAGRRSPVATDKTVSLPCDTLISALGEKTDLEFLAEYGITPDASGRPPFRSDNVFVLGDLRRGPATVVEAMADALAARDAIVGSPLKYPIPEGAAMSLCSAIERKGVLTVKDPEPLRCLGCQVLCENCVTACPNRANAAIRIPGKAMPQILHLDYACNECGNCAAFCPYDSAPYKDKFTLFATMEDMQESRNSGFFVADREKELLHVRLEGKEFDCCLKEDTPMSRELETFLSTVLHHYEYLLV